MNLTDTLQHWLQGQINVSIDGVLARLDRLEEFNVDDQITGLRMENDRLLRKLEATSKDLNDLNTQLHRVNVDLADRIERLEQERSDTDAVIRGQARAIEQLEARVSELEDRAVEAAPDEQLEGFSDRVRDIVADYVDNDDQLMTRHVFDEMVEAFINESVFKIKVR